MKQHTDAIADRAFTRSLWSMFACILLCLALLCSVTYAWFSDRIESDRNALVSGSFLLDFQVKDSYGNEIPLTTNLYRPTARVAKLPSAGVYTVTLTLKPGSDARGYCIVTWYDELTYPKLTDVIVGPDTQNAGEHAPNTPFVFQVEVDSYEEMILEPCCGVPSSTKIYDGTLIQFDEFKIQHE